MQNAAFSGEIVRRTRRNLESTPCHGKKLAMANPPSRRATALSWLPRLCAATVGAILSSAPAKAGELYSGDDFILRWDNTVRYSAAFRIEPRSGDLISYPNSDDGDRNFTQGLISNRLDVMSKLDLSHGDLGLHASADGWYDTVYHMRTANSSEATYNVTSVPSTRFAPAVRDLYGQYAELGDLFAYDSFTIADIPVSARLGRQTLLWGESLFYDTNSIASAQTPTDYTRTMGVQSAYTSAYTSDIYLPVTQLSATVQPLPNVAISLYDQFEWRPSRQPGDGSYFDYTDFIGAGAGRLFLPSGQAVTRVSDRKAPARGQYGAALHITLGDLDLGLYALRFNAKEPDVVIVPGRSSNAPGSYWLTYPTGIKLYGASFSSHLGDSSIAGEISARQNMPLVPYGSPDEQAAIPPARGQRTYVKGDAIHAQLSATTTVGRGSIWDSADLSAEVAADDVVGITTGAIAPGRWYGFAAKARFLVEPHYFQVLPNVDLTVPVGLGYNLTGHSLNYYAQNAGAGDFEIGVSATYLSVWKANLTLTEFIGTTDQQPLADRAFVLISVERTF